jgi:UDP-glucose 4-epimerase
MHFAANALVGESMENPSKYFRNNVSCGIDLLDMAVEFGVKKFVFSSTCATFGIPERMPIDESLPQRPINPYGESKLMFETTLRWYREIHKLSFVALRYFNAAGASEKFGEDHRIETHLIPNILKVALGQRESVDIFGTDYPTPDGTCIRDYIHILDDLAEAHILAVLSDKSDFFIIWAPEEEPRFVKSSRHVKKSQVAKSRRSRSHAAPGIHLASSPHRKKFAPKLGWTPRFQNIVPIVESAWAWHLKHPNGYGD